MELTNQEGVNWFLNQIQQKTRVKKKTSFPRIISQTFNKPIFNQSPLTQNLLLKFFLKRIFSLTFSKLIKTIMRKKDKIKRRCTPIFILVHYAYRILTSNHNPSQFLPQKKRLRYPTLGSFVNKSLRETYP